jgi:hypothetical protein
MASTGTAVPGNVNLSRQKPYAVSAYSRRVKSLANNAQSFGPDSYVNITLDTSTPGSFLDPLQSYLKFDLVIRNTNLFADYISFGLAGAASLIEEFRIYVQGTPIEEILQYNVFYELAMSQNGQCQQPFQLFRPSTITQGVSHIFNQSAIKSPMVDFDGRPMYGEVRHSDYHTTSSRGVSWAYPISQTGNEDTNPKFLGAKMIASQASVGTRICFSGCRPYYSGAGAAANAIYKNTIADPHALIFGNNIPTTTAAGVATGNATFSAPANSNALYPTFVQSLTTVDQVVLPVVTAFTPATAGAGASLVQGQGACGLEQYNLTSVNSTSANAVSSFTNYLSQPSGFLPYAGSTVEIPSLFTGSANAGAGANPYVDPDFDPRNPLNWCSILPSTDIRPETKTLGPDNLQDYFMFLANTKYLPIGLAGRNKYSPADLAPTRTPGEFATFGSNNFRNFAEYKGTNNGKEFIYTCCIPLISGVLGSFAEKCWPTMLVAPGSMYIQIRTATAQKAFQLSMDPCRRVLGSIRDFLPFGGSVGGLFGQFSAPSITTLPKGDLTDTSQFFNRAPGVVIGSLEQGPNGHLPMNTFTDYQAPSNFNVATAAGYTQITPVKAAPRIHTYLNGFSCIGASLFSANNYMTNSYIRVGDTATKGAALMFRPYGVAAMEGRWTIGKAYVSQFTGSGNHTYMQATEEGSRILPSPLAGGAYDSGTNLSPNITLGAINMALVPSVPITDAVPTRQASSVGITNNNIAGGQGVNPLLQGDVQVEFSPAGIPLPQYILHSQPWLRKEFFCSVNQFKQYIFCGEIQNEVASEASACYGTYLSASVPQSRRVFTNNQENGTTTYVLQNIEFVSQQIILPDSVAASILEDASQGDISITANSVHNYQTPIAQSTSQNLIIPAKIASANTMYCLFVPGAFVSGNESALYNSLRGICPFGSVQAISGLNTNGLMSPYDLNNVGLGYIGNQLEVINVPCNAGQFQIQLKVGNELIPQQPLTTISELLTENVKAQHKLFDTRSNVNALMSLCTSIRYRMGGEYTQGLSYDTIRGGNFTTTFVSAALCDDQTAINSPSMVYAYACEANYLKTIGGRQKSLSDYVITRAPHNFELFQPPESTFVLAFDMDTWSRVSDVARSGKYLGNNTITLSLQNAVALGNQTQNSGSAGYTLQTFVVHDIRFSFQAGGSVVSYY